MEPIRFQNRHSGHLETEVVYGESFLRRTYGNPLGALALHGMVKRHWFSKWYGWRMNRPGSATRIAAFIDHYGIDAADFLDAPDSFANFNEFFYRRLKTDARPIDPHPDHLVFPADGRHLGFARASQIEGVFVKGQRFNLGRLLGDDQLARTYANGTLVLSRLCPVDYHRFHFPCAGTPGEAQLINGPLFSVSPIALRRNLSFLWRNKRMITRLETERLGTVLCIEIGATCVGTIHQTYTPGLPCGKGAEKGYFAFGGSSTITLFEPGRVLLENDLLESSARQTELYARVGSCMARIA